MVTKRRILTLGLTLVVAIVVGVIGYRILNALPGEPRLRNSDQNAPMADFLSRGLGGPVRPAPGEVNQFLVSGPRDDTALARLGTVTIDLEDNVGVNLPSGQQIGLRFNR